MVPIPVLPGTPDTTAPEGAISEPAIAQARTSWPVVRPPVLFYRTPGKASAEGAEAFADDGDRVVLRVGAALPPRCCLCNEPMHGKAARYVLIWQIRGRNAGCNVSYGNLKLGMEGVVLPLNVFYCRRHRFRRWTKHFLAGMVLLGVVLVGASVNWLEQTVSRNVSFLAAVSIIPMLCSLILIGQRRGPFKIAARRNNDFWITGFGPAYVRSLPSWKELKAAEAENIAGKFGEIS
jgi:hypothetical protein